MPQTIEQEPSTPTGAVNENAEQQERLLTHQDILSAPDPQAAFEAIKANPELVHSLVRGAEQSVATDAVELETMLRTSGEKRAFSQSELEYSAFMDLVLGDKAQQMDVDGHDENDIKLAIAQDIAVSQARIIEDEQDLRVRGSFLERARDWLSESEKRQKIAKVGKVVGAVALAAAGGLAGGAIAGTIATGILGLGLSSVGRSAASAALRSASESGANNFLGGVEEHEDVEPSRVLAGQPGFEDRETITYAADEHAREVFGALNERHTLKESGDDPRMIVREMLGDATQLLHEEYFAVSALEQRQERAAPKVGQGAVMLAAAA